MAQPLTAKEQPLSKIFSDDYVFSIPGYQRPYSWGTEQARELLEDILDAVKVAPADLSDAAPYFLGSIVLIKKDASPDATVVDGQQRLTTLTLLLSSVRAVVNDADIRAGITRCIYEKGSVVFSTQARYRLSLRDRDREFFRQYVQHEDGLPLLASMNSQLADSQVRLRDNAKLFLGDLAKLETGTLTRLVQYIVTRCYLVVVATPDLDSAYRIFGVLNSRGLDLSATDILKAEILGALKEEERDVYTKKWEDVEEDLGRDSFGDLFSHIRMVYRKAKPKSTLLKEFREHVGAASEPAQFLDGVLLPMAGAFGEITSASYSSQSNPEVINESLFWLNRLEFADWVPPALAFYVRSKNDPEAMASFFQKLERLGFSMLLRKCGINERIERFSALTAAVEKQADLAAEQSPLELSPGEQLETYNALNGPLYATHSARALSLILLRLDRLLGDASAKYQHNVISVEHVLPQQPASNSAWVQWIPENEVRARWVHRLGNLTLLSRAKNSSASNYDFEKKKLSYFTKGGVSTFALTTQVLQHGTWSADVMRSRQDDLLQVLEQHWDLGGRQAAKQLGDKLLDELGGPSHGYPVFEIESIKHGLHARARETGSSFVVLAGSQARANWTSQPHAYEKLHQGLVQSGALGATPDGSCLQFLRDITFKSPSAASATVLGRPDNGRLSWRMEGSSITYAAWQASLSSDVSASGRAEEGA